MRQSRQENGFTLVEMLIVLAIISLLVVFALPKFAKNISKTKMTDAMNALRSASSQAENYCATKNAATLPADLTIFMGESPSGYNAISVSGGNNTCPAYILMFAPVSATDLPSLCIKRGPNAHFTYGYAALPATLTQADIPIPDNLLTTDCTARGL